MSLVVPSRGGLERRRAAPAVSPVAWSATDELAYDQWLRQGHQLGLVGRSAGWWIGDWLRYGTARYGSKYAQAAHVTGYDIQTLMNMVYVATRVEATRRRAKLSWSHHAELASLDPEDQEDWLERAIAERLTVRGLRRELVTANQRTRSGSEGALSAGTATRHEEAERLTCPGCGHRFVPGSL